MSYNLTLLQNSNGIFDMVKYANDASSHVLMNFLVIVIFVICLLALKRYDFDKALFASSFICMLISTLLFMMNFTSLLIPLAFLFLIIILAFVYGFKGGSAAG